MFIPGFWLLTTILSAVEILLLARVLISWVPAWRRTVWGLLVKALTEPILFPLRRIAHLPSGPDVAFDLSPMVALFIIQLLRSLLRI